LEILFYRQVHRTVILPLLPLFHQMQILVKDNV
jgi:hypothetical protein